MLIIWPTTFAMNDIIGVTICIIVLITFATIPTIVVIAGMIYVVMIFPIVVNIGASTLTSWDIIGASEVTI